MNYRMISGTMLLAAVTVLSTGCTRMVSSNISDDGRVHADDIVFPDIDKAWQRQGQFPNIENLSKIRPGVSKDELYQLLGRPHFSEAQRAREWDYILKFYDANDQVQVCQYKVIFDTEFRGQEFYWLPADCARYARAASTTGSRVLPLTASLQAQKINLSADALFDFDRWQLADMRPTGRASLNELAEKLRRYQTQGDSRVIITGYTDRLGDDMYNLNLSQLRAQSVREYLISQGVDAATMTAAGAGNASPIAECPTANYQDRQQLIDCLQPNRRVEVAVAVYQQK